MAERSARTRALTAKDIGLVITRTTRTRSKTGSSYARGALAPEQILRVGLPAKATLTPDEFQGLKAAIDARFNTRIQALALAWTEPYAVNCNSITGALALGYDADLCAHTCAPSKASPYFNASSARPYTDLKLRPSMLLAAPDVAAAKALIRRGIQADHSLGLRGAPPVHAYFIATADTARNVRAPLFPRPARCPVSASSCTSARKNRCATPAGCCWSRRVPRRSSISTRLHWVPGALADHLTSFGGLLGSRAAR
jgi:uncharacterized protein (TIGR03790 family)